MPETATSARTRAGTKEPPPWELVAPLVQGSDLGHGWKLSDLSGLVAGSVVATLEHVGAQQERVHICRRDGEPRGIVSTSECDLLIMNSGNSDRPTDEGLAQAVARLGLAIHERERTGAAAGTAATLLSHDERLARYSSEDGGSLR